MTDGRSGIAYVQARARSLSTYAMQIRLRYDAGIKPHTHNVQQIRTMAAELHRAVLAWLAIVDEDTRAGVHPARDDDRGD